MKLIPITLISAAFLVGISTDLRAQEDASSPDIPGRTAADVSAAPAPVPINPPDDVPVKNHLADPNYQLQADDMLEVLVFREPDLTTDGIVRKDGSFNMKLVGAIKVAGLTADQAGERLRVALATDYLVNPRVDVGMLEYARKKIDVLGEVRSPGVYLFPSRGPMRLSDAVAMAGGFLPGADLAHVSVRRMKDDKTATIEVNAEAGGEDSFFLQPDDAVSIAVLPKRHFTVLGQIARPGTYDFTDNHPIYLTDAIAVAGGFTRIADPSHVRLKRTADGRETVQEVNAKAMANSPTTQRLVLQNEDTITVGESLF